MISSVKIKYPKFKKKVPIVEKKADESVEEKTTEDDVDDLESVNSSEALKSVRSMVMEAIAIVQVMLMKSGTNNKEAIKLF